VRRINLLLVTLSLVVACGDAGAETTTTGPDATTTSAGETTTTPVEAAFPVTVTAANGEVEIAAEPNAIISLSPSATENLFAVGAGEQVIAVDDQSSYPEDAPVTDLSGFTPNLEAILAFEPDLVVITFDPGGIIDGLNAVGVPVLSLPSATSVSDAYSEIETLGAATGHLGEAAEVVSAMESEIEAIVAEFGPAVEGTSIYHELDPTYYSVSSHSYVGELYQRLGLVNIADAADPDGFGYPQLSAEYIVDEDPDVILLADAGFGESIATLEQRPGWSDLSAIAAGAVLEVDPDLSSRWTPRSLVFLRDVAAEIAQLVPVS
jgi:iron complex transport system substrate-binding protein